MNYNAAQNVLQFCNGTSWVYMGNENAGASGTSCSSPTGTEGAYRYNSTTNTLQFCNGSAWMDVSGLQYGGASGTACTAPVGAEGVMSYNAGGNMLEFCNGQDWVEARKRYACLAGNNSSGGTQCSVGAMAHAANIGGTCSEKGSCTASCDDGSLNFSNSCAAWIYAWLSGSWGACSNTCGNGTQSRSVVCERDDSTTVADGLCSGGKPSTSQACTQYISTYSWDTGGWGACSASCGGGTQTRSVTCERACDTTTVADGSCSGGKPAISQACNPQSCSADWNSCSPTEIRVTASDGALNDHLGYSIAMTNDKIVVGAPLDDSAKGSMYVYDASTGAQLRKLVASDGIGGDRVGWRVAISGDVVVTGAYGGDGNATDSGTAYVFNASTGAQLRELKATDGAASDYMGYDVDIEGDVALVGSPFDDGAGADSGSVYLFNVNTGAQIRKLTASDAAASDQFGRGVAISGDKIVIGAPFDDDKGSNSGSVYVFDANTGAQLRKMTASDGAASDSFGLDVAISGDKIVVSASANDDAGTSSGSAYIFDANTGAQLYKLTASDAAQGDFFGAGVAILDDTVVIGAYGDDNGSDVVAGALYVFDANTGAQIRKLTASDGADADRDALGWQVALSDNAIVGGAYHDSDKTGAAYIYKCP